ncbi:NCS2 family permease [Ruthenibacterium sp. CLA-JM-H11]|uniref:NCS2 family permease n=1 Tax=Ruthenibacterium intestinale TaxID=3133163 RepID=A0ABV1GEH1_9FIRM
MEKFFRLKEHGTTVKTEIIAGITTFLAMAYILAVNPSMLGAAGMNTAGVFVATALSAAFATVIMAFWANYPIALASGMGLNAYFAYTVCGSLSAQGFEDPWRIALTAILVEGIIFIILSAFKFRETLVNSIPENLKYGITAGIGLFISIVGLKGAGVIVANESTLVALGNVGDASVALALIGIALIGIMLYYNIKGAILWGILITWILGIFAQLSGWYTGVSVLPDFANNSFMAGFAGMGEIAFKFDFSYVASNVVDFAVIVFAFLFVDLFDTVGTLIGVAAKGDMLDKEGKLPRVGRALMSDAIGTVAGACMGTSTVTSYVESSAGVAEGGRTGLTALTTAVLFILSIFLAPIFLAIPGFATAPALVIVGMLMMSSVSKVKFEGDTADVLGAFVAIIMMPFTYSIANGIMFGVLAWLVLKVVRGKIKDIHPVMWIVGALFVLRIVTIILGVSS